MNREQLDRVKEAFLRLQYQPIGDRDAAAREECGDDAEVFERVRCLLRAEPPVDVPIDGARASAPEHVLGDADSARDGAASFADAPKTGDVVLGRYEMRDEIGAGAFGVVYRAFDRVTRETVAVKAVELKTRRAREWSRRETASLRRARVPGVVELLATGETDNWAIVVMALVDGRPFPGDGVATGDAAAILPRAVSLLEALGHLHASGVYHRDLKPSNVLVSAEGLVTLVDFGIAQDETDAARWRPGELIAGTFDFIAPERFRGERADAKSDLYAVGVMLITALTGLAPPSARAPMPAESVGGYEAALSGVVPEPVARLIRSLVAREARDRPETAAAALERLRAALGTRDELRLPWLGDDGVVRAIVEAAAAGRPLDVVGASGSGRTRALEEAESRLRATGCLVHWVRPHGDEAARAGPSVAATWIGDASPDALDGEHVAALRRRVRDGLVLLVDDFDRLDAPTRGLVDSLRPFGAVIRVVREPVGECVRLGDLAALDLEALVRGPERIFHVRSEVAKLLWNRTRGRPGDVLRAVRSWHATGLARWNGALDVAPRDLDRLRAMAVPPTAVSTPGRLSSTARDLWNALTLIAEPVSVAALAGVLELPQRVVAAELDVLIAEELVLPCGTADRVEIARTSPSFADVPLEVRRVWSERAAEHLPARSEGRFHHLVAAGLYEPACRAALAVASAQIDAGNIPAAVAVLDPALAIARRHVAAEADLYADLLASMADAALARATRAAVDLALYHANLAPARDRRVAAWTSILEAAASVLGGDARRALELLDAAGDLPTEAHHRATHVVGTFAGRMTRSLDVQRARVAACTAWARRSDCERDARAVVSASVGWLRYESGRFEASYRLHARAARLTRRSRPRRSSLCNAAMAAIEAGEFDAASALAEDALRAARRGGDWVNEARSELLVRQCEFRRRGKSDVDVELLQDARSLDRDGVRGMIRLTEAATAWRIRRLDLAGALASEAATDLRASGFTAAAVLGAALAAASGGRCDVEMLSLLSDSLEPTGIAAQAAALAPRPISAAVARRARDWARAASHPDMPREVLSPRETDARLVDTPGDTVRTVS